MVFQLECTPQNNSLLDRLAESVTFGRICFYYKYLCEFFTGMGDKAESVTFQAESVTFQAESVTFQAESVTFHFW